MNIPSGGKFDAVIVGAGPNGLAAAITLARAGKKVLVLESRETIGGGSRTAELTLPGFRHDVCSAIHPLGVASPFFRGLPLAQFGLEWVFPPAALAHPLDGGRAVLVERSVEATAARMGRDAAAYRRLYGTFSRRWQVLLDDLLGPFPLPPHHPLTLGTFGAMALLPAAWLARLLFRQPQTRALFAGQAAHSMLPLEAPVTSSFGLIMGILTHAVGWPMARRGSQAIVDAMAGYLLSLGGEIVTGRHVQSIDQLPPSSATLFDLTPRQLVRIAGDALPQNYRHALDRFRYGPGVCKIDYALDSPVPWQARECRQAATVHLGGELEEIAASERAVWAGQHPERPYVLFVQQSLFDPSRAPQGKHTAWAYCHVPHGSTFDMTSRIEAQIERFAPGFQARILARHVRNAAQMEEYNPNYIGGDINGGVQDIWQFFTRPVARRVPYSTPARGIYLCSSSTPPGGGVHGMCGYHAAQAVLKQLF